MRSRFGFVSLSLLFAGCPESRSEPDAFVPRDAVAMDMGTAQTDAFAPPDSGSDVGPADSDGDGVPDSMDCAPTDRAQGANATRPCTGTCGAGTETCANGVWAACNAPTDCVCTRAGATRAAPCGMCGRRLETCSAALRWEAMGACESEGVCVAGTVEERRGAFCDVVRFTCSSTTCTWDAGVEISPRGECVHGAVECRPPYGDLATDSICTDDCHLVRNPMCP